MIDMNKQDTIDDIMPSAAPSEEDIRRWQALPEDEQKKRLQKAIEDGFNSGISNRTVDEIWESAKAKALHKNG